MVDAQCGGDGPDSGRGQGPRIGGSPGLAGSQLTAVEGGDLSSQVGAATDRTSRN